MIKPTDTPSAADPRIHGYHAHVYFNANTLAQARARCEAAAARFPLKMGRMVFTHLITGQDLIDHRDRAMWMGDVRPLELSVLPETSVEYVL